MTTEKDQPADETAVEAKERDSQTTSPPPTDRYQPKPVSPWSYKGIRRRMRTMGGQLTMIGLSYLGALVMAVAAHFVRPLIFDPYIRQRMPEVNEKFIARLQEMADGKISPDTIQEYTPGQVHMAFAILIDGHIEDRKKIVSRQLAEYQSQTVIVRLQITAATGSEPQQQNAVFMLEAGAEHLPPNEAVKICRYIREQARRRGRSSLYEAADRAVNQLESIVQKDQKNV